MGRGSAYGVSHKGKDRGLNEVQVLESVLVESSKGVSRKNESR